MSDSVISPGKDLQRTEERLLKQRTPGERFFQLDALRGIAAVCVVFHHWRLAFNTGLPHLWMVPFCSGSQAVMLFFTLSGFVLSLPYLAGKNRPYWPYLIRRFWRIYVPFAAAIALSAIFAKIFYGHRLPLTAWYYSTWQSPVKPKLLLLQLLMDPISALNTAFWSLSVEVQFSIIMPFLATAVRRLSAVGCFVVLVLWGLTLPLLKTTHIFFFSAWFFAQYGPLFFAGAILAKYRVQVGSAFEKVRPCSWLLLALSFIIYLDYHRPDWHFYNKLETYEPFISGLGAIGLIICALNMPRVARTLEHSIPEYLGRISYSLYLVHSVVIFSVLDLLYGKMPVPALTVLVVALAIGMGHIFCVLIEEPAMRTGKRLAG